MYLKLNICSSESQTRGECPRGREVSSCDFDYDINCLEDMDCTTRGKICCPDGCNKSCMDPIRRPPTKARRLKCPRRGPPSYTPCVFDPETNCVENSDCGDVRICCPSECGKECVYGVDTSRQYARRGEVWLR